MGGVPERKEGKREGRLEKWECAWGGSFQAVRSRRLSSLPSLLPF